MTSSTANPGGGPSPRAAPHDEGRVRTQKPSIDDAPFGAFHRRLAIYSCGGPFCDGYILGIIAIALPALSKDLGLDPSWTGLIAAASLIGMFIGGALFGFLTDIFGRQVMYTLDLLLLVAGSAAQYWVHDPWVLFALRFVLGLAVGADYPIATALLSEFSPKGQRGMLLAAMIGAWWLGYAVSFVIGYALSTDDVSPWRWMLASSAVPAAAVSLLRWGTPESPRWLMSKGRVEEARALVHRHLGSEFEIEEPPPVKTDWRAIFRGHYVGRTLFVCIFWSCQVIPTFAIYTFAPDLLRALGARNPTLGAAIISLFFLVGVIPAIALVDKVGRRPVIIVPFAVTGITLVLLGLIPSHSSAWVAACFIVFAIFNAGSSVLQWVYPSELFPTEVRATALGFGTSVSRIGAAVGTFFFPIGLMQLGVRTMMLIVGGFCFIGFFVSLAFAPETRGLSLAESSGIRSSSDSRRE
jgi:MFS transporter, putative metabolite transport protein